jgi:histidinol-phosphate aminotransferase
MERKIIVRDRSKVAKCGGCLRITVGVPEENARLISTLKELSGIHINPISKPLQA